MKQADLFDAAQANAAKAAGMASVDGGADAEWSALMEGYAVATAREMPFFTSDDVFRRAPAVRDDRNHPRSTRPRASHARIASRRLPQGKRSPGQLTAAPHATLRHSPYGKASYHLRGGQRHEERRSLGHLRGDGAGSPRLWRDPLRAFWGVISADR